MADVRFEYYPPASDVLVVEGDELAAYRFLGADGLGPVPVQPKSIRSPGQRGVTAVDILVPQRVVSLQFFSQYRTAEEYWTKRRTLSRALVVEPPLDDDLPLGVLRLVRDGFDAREVECLPMSAPIPMPKGKVGKIDMDVDFYCPSPYWQEAEDTTITLSASGGGIEFANTGFTLDNAGFEIGGNDVEQEIVNEGDVSTPVVVQMYGEATTVRIMNVTTGETLEITGAVAAGDYVEVNTAFGNKRVELVSGGVRTSIMDRLNLADADFWLLRPGSNIVRFEADINVSGRAVVSWRQQYGGL